jgi:hypothetical protein
MLDPVYNINLVLATTKIFILADQKWKNRRIILYSRLSYGNIG